MNIKLDRYLITTSGSHAIIETRKGTKIEANRLISLTVQKDKRGDFNRCIIKLDNTFLYYNNIFIQNFPARRQRYQKRRLSVQISRTRGDFKTVFTGIIRRVYSEYGETGETFTIEAVTFEWLLHKTKLKNPLIIDKRNPIEDIRKLFSDADLAKAFRADNFDEFNPRYYQDVKFTFPETMTVLSVLKKLAFYMRMIFWIDDSGIARMKDRERYFTKPERFAVTTHQNLVFGTDIISAKFLERDLDYEYDRFEVHAETPASELDTERNYDERMGAAGARSGSLADRTLNLHFGYISARGSITHYLNELAKELKARFNNTPITARLRVIGNPYITSHWRGKVIERNDIVRLVSPLPADVGFATEGLTSQSFTMGEARRRYKDYRHGKFFVEAVTHTVTAEGFYTDVELSQDYYESREQLIRSFRDEATHFLQRKIFTGVVTDVDVSSGDTRHIAFQVKVAGMDRPLVNVGYSTWSASIDHGVIALPQKGSKVIVARTGLNQHYIIGELFTNKYRPGYNKDVDIIRIGNFAFQLKNDGTLYVGSSTSAPGSFKQIALSDHVHDLPDHTHNGVTIGAGVTGNPVGSVTVQAPTSGLSPTKIQCEKGS